LKQADDPVPPISKSGKPFNLLPASPVSVIGYNAPTLEALTFQRARTKTITSRPRLGTSRVSPKAAASSLIKAFKVITLLTLFSADILYINTQLSGCASCSWIVIGNFTKHHDLYSSFRGILLFFLHFYLLNIQSYTRFCSNKRAYRQARQACRLPNQQMSMPPSQLLLKHKQSVKLRPMLKPNKNDRNLHQPLYLLQHPSVSPLM
jgi:hypothetical protein